MKTMFKLVYQVTKIKNNKNKECFAKFNLIKF